jgi:hypothetical protein
MADILDAYKLFHEGAQVLSRMEQAGLRIDLDYIADKKKWINQEIINVENQFLSSKLGREWRKSSKTKINIYSGDQLGYFLYTVKGIKPPKFTKTEKGSTDEEALQQLELPDLHHLLRIKKLKKIKDYLDIFERETVDGYIHPFYHLHLVTTYRSSSSNPNWQNIPKRDKEAMDIIRKAIYPRPGHQLVEIDFKQLEVRIAATYCEDQKLIHDVLEGDMHRDMACEIFKIKNYNPEDKTHKVLRNAAKNGFVFPEFYGDFYKNCAVNLAYNWGQLSKINNWKKGQGIEFEKGYLSDHLIANGFKNLWQFTEHLKDIEYMFWNRRYKTYTKWKESWWQEYQRSGYFESKTGFVYRGVMNRKEAINYPIQGCLQGKSKILTNKGLIPIKDLYGKSTLVWTGFKWAEAVGMQMGKCQLAKIELSSGLTINCDTRHKLKNELNEWIDFKDLKIGSYVALPKIDKIIPASVNMNWHFIYGFLIGDGYLFHREAISKTTNDRKGISITVGKVKKDILISIREFFKNKGYKVNYHISRFPESNRANKYTILIEKKKLVNYLENIGFIFGKNAHTKRIPESIWASTEQEKRDFLEGLWLSDGSRGKWSKRDLHMCNEPLLKEVQILASSLGFDSCLRKTSCGFKLSFYWKEFNRKPNRKVPRTTIDLATKNTQFIWNLQNNEEITEKRCFNSGKAISQYVGERIINKFNPNFEIYRYDTIKNITILDKEAKTYTMAVNEPLHQFVADGVITKNSAFHCLLWSLIEGMKAQKAEHWDSKIVGQIHDAIIIDANPQEIEHIVNVMKCIMCHDLQVTWKWINIPLDIDIEICDIDKSWAEKKSYVA